MSIVRLLLPACCCAISMAADSLPAPAGEVMLAPAIAPAVADGQPATITLVRRGHLGLVRSEDQAIPGGVSVRRREMSGDRLLVTLRPGTDADAVARDQGGTLTGRAVRTGTWRMAIPVRAHHDLPAAQARLAADPRVVNVSPDWIVQPIGDPDDPSYAQLWGMHNTGQTGGSADADIDAPEAWDISTGSRSVLVGIIDSGVDRDHPDLAANMWTNPGETGLDTSGNDRRTNGLDDDGNGYIDDWRGWDFINDDNDPADDHGHGTHVAGTIGATGGNGIGVTGVCWQVSMVGLKFLGPFGGYTSDAVEAVDYATRIGCNLTSNSWGGGGYSQELVDAIARAGTAGHLFVAAAGNSSWDNDLSPLYPSSYTLDNIISVAATSHSDALAWFSCFGATSVDLAAPGVNTLSTMPGASYGTMSGTSMATPHVSGSIALMLSVNPSLTPAQIKSALLENTDPLPALAGKMVSGGRLNLHRSLLAIAGPRITADAVQISEAIVGDGIISPGESARISVRLRNAGSEILTGVHGSLHSVDGHLVISDGTVDFGTIALGSSMDGDAPLLIDVPVDTGTPLDAQLELVVRADAGGPWSIPITVTVRRVGILSGRVLRIGSADGVAGAVVTCSGPSSFSTTTEADGTWSLSVSDGTYDIGASAPGLSLLAQAQAIVPPGASGIDLQMGIPRLALDPASLAVSLESGGSTTATVIVRNDGDMPLAGTISVDAEPYRATGLWHRASHRSPSGDSAWYYGRDDTRSYDTGSRNSGSLTTPEITIAADAVALTFREWRQTQGSWYWDQSLVEYRLPDTGTWQVLYQSTTNSGSWAGVSLPLYALRGKRAIFRFRFDTIDGYDNAHEGWYIDDIAIDGQDIAPWLSVDSSSIDLPSGASISLQLGIDASSLSSGEFQGALRFATNDPILPAALHVTDLTVSGGNPLDVDLIYTWLNDYNSPPMIGDSDGVPEAGETIGLYTYIANNGSTILTGLEGTLLCDSPYAQIVVASATFNDLYPFSNAYNWSPMCIRIDPACPIGTVIPLRLILRDDLGQTTALEWSVTVSWTGSISGRITMAGSGEPIASAYVSIDGYATFTDDDGRYQLTAIPAGTYTITASRYTYDTATGQVTVPPNATWDATLAGRQLTITPTPVTLSGTLSQDARGTVSLSAIAGRDVAWSTITTGPGFTYSTSDMTDGPEFIWRDLVGNGTAIDISGDDINVGPFPIGFAFPFFGNAWEDLRICSNGWISFDSTSTSYAATYLPYQYAPRNMIAALWSDLYLAPGEGSIWTSASSDAFTIQYDNVRLLSNPSWHATFQIILQRDGSILLYYKHVDNPNLGTIGLQDASGTRGLSCPFAPHGGLAVLFTPMAERLRCEPHAGVAIAGTPTDMLITCDTAGLTVGSHSFELGIASDDDDSPLQTVPIIVEVVNPHAPVVDGRFLSVQRNVPTTTTITGSDADGDTITFSVHIPPLHGILSGALPALVYIPNAGYTGPDAFAVIASDGDRQSAPAIILIEVHTGTSTPPVASPAAAETDEDTATSVVLAAIDPDGDPIGWSLLSAPEHGTAWLAGNTLHYQPDPDWNGTDAVLVAPYDAFAQGEAIQVPITVRSIDDAPTATGATAVVNQGAVVTVPVACSDPDGDLLGLRLVTPPSFGSIIVEGNTLHFTAPSSRSGQAVVVLQAIDAMGLTSAPIEVRITVLTEGGNTDQAAGSGGGCGTGAAAILLALTCGIGLRRRRR